MKTTCLIIILVIFSCQQNPSELCDSVVRKVNIGTTLNLINATNLEYETGFNELGYIEFPFTLQGNKRFSEIFNNPNLHFENIKQILNSPKQKEINKTVALYSMGKLCLKKYYELINIILNCDINDPKNEKLLNIALSQDIKFTELQSDNQSVEFNLMIKQINKLKTSYQLKERINYLLENN